MLRRGAGVVAGLSVLALAGSAAARCAAPTAGIVWSYPDDATDSVPPDAVFWAVSAAGDVEVEIDGVPLSALGTGIARHQFASALPLEPGEHEFVATVSIDEAGAGARLGDRRVRFQAVAGDRREADVSIDSVKVYPLVFSGDRVSHPPDNEYDTECSEQALRPGGECDDIIPASLARIEYAPRGDAIAYLAQGDVLLPPGCASFWTSGNATSDGANTGDPFRVAAVLPTGVSAEHTFAGPIEVRSVDAAHAEAKPESAACSIAFGARSGQDRSGMLVLVGVFVSMLRRARRRASRFRRDHFHSRVTVASVFAALIGTCYTGIQGAGAVARSRGRAPRVRQREMHHDKLRSAQGPCARAEAGQR